MKQSQAEILLAKHLTELGLRFQQEYKFHPQRKWRLDFVIWTPELSNTMTAIEIDGFHKGRHGKGWGADYDKQNHAVALGWKLYRFGTQDVLRGRAKEFLRQHVLGK